MTGPLHASALDWWVELGSSAAAAVLLLWRAFRPRHPRRDRES